ncbi:hypothetical protein IFT48_04650 [Pseudomonas fluorescens]|uniref:hypothetical protein n=1 Tax=Pseudomonas TaxID=286 RepID=UPI000F023630|nr:MULTISPECIES: hypothetical protein [Pseudomonas]MBD8089263.1 hypothetical protein [Pseudomonas fluorescens]MBD8615310.1 hypothetical protein [Pseudomonas putida]
MARENNPLVGKNPEETLLLNLGHEILNFRPDFPKTSLKHTFILGPYGSSTFGLMPSNGQVYLGIPKRFYDRFKSAKWLYAARVENQAGLFLVMQIGSGEASHPVGIRIFVRTKRLMALGDDVKVLRAVPMDRHGITRENDILQGFTLKLMQVKQYVWEISATEEEDSW